MANERVRIKLGSVEIEFEGEGDFARSGVLGLLQEALALAPKSVAPVDRIDEHGDPGAGQAVQEELGGVTVATIAAHLEPRGAQDLILCALARLQLLQGASEVSRDDIWEAMKGATGYFKASMNKNFPRDLARMVKRKKINEVASGMYSLTASTRKELEAKLADVG